MGELEEKWKRSPNSESGLPRNFFGLMGFAFCGEVSVYRCCERECCRFEQNVFQEKLFGVFGHPNSGTSA
jgi:hypothetical protein